MKVIKTPGPFEIYTFFPETKEEEKVMRTTISINNWKVEEKKIITPPEDPFDLGKCTECYQAWAVQHFHDDPVCEECFRCLVANKDKICIVKSVTPPTAVSPDLGICMECKDAPATGQYGNGGYLVCQSCNDSMNKYFDEEYR